MSSSTDSRQAARTRAQNQFKSSDQREDAIRAEIEKERAAVDAKTAKLRALRLAKEAEEKAEAERIAAEAPPKKSTAGSGKKSSKKAK